MTDAAIKAAGWLSGTLKKQILNARKDSRAKIKSHLEAGKLPGATPKKPKEKTRVDWSKVKGTDHKDPEDFGGPLRRSKPTTKPQKLRKTRLRSFLEDEVNKKAGGGKVGMSHQGLYPAEEARSGTMSEKERAKHMKKGGQVKKKKKQQGYKDRKDESIAMRVKKKRTKKQLKASRDESYGKWGSAAKKRGKINRSSSKGWDGNREVSRHYDS